MAEHRRVRADVFQRRLGAAIRDTREKAGLSRERVANAVDLSVRFLFDIEAGLKSPSMPSCDGPKSANPSLSGKRLDWLHGTAH
jgi:DNA-binding XRE family transcriptional regulator